MFRTQFCLLMEITQQGKALAATAVKLVAVVLAVSPESSPCALVCKQTQNRQQTRHWNVSV